MSSENVVRETRLHRCSFHVGLGFESPLIYDESIQRSKQIFDEAEKLGFKMTVLNIGGSFPGGVRRRKQFLQVAAVVQGSLERNFPVGCGVKVIAEPGQFFSTSAWILCAKVVAVKDTVIDATYTPGMSNDLKSRMSRMQPVYKVFNQLSESHSAKHLEDAVAEGTVEDEHHSKLR